MSFQCLMFLAEPDLSVSTPACLPRLYETLLADHIGPFPGLRLGHHRNAHTTEQKLWSVGYLVDAILFPYWDSKKLLRLYFGRPSCALEAGRLARIQAFPRRFAVHPHLRILVVAFEPEADRHRGGWTREGRPKWQIFSGCCECKVTEG